MIGDSAALGQDLGVAGMRNSGFVQGFLVQWKRRDCVEAVFPGEVDGRGQEVKRGAAGARIGQSRLDAGKIRSIAEG